MKVRVLKDACSGCEECVETCPAVFQMDDEGLAVVIVNEVGEGDRAACREAAENCPSEAIQIID